MRKLNAREKRMFFYLGLIIAFIVADSLWRRWNPTNTLESSHYIIYSSASKEQTQQTAQIAEMVYQAYGRLATNMDIALQPHEKLKVKLFKDRDEFRRCNRNVGWAEGFYKKPYCHQYFSATEPNPYHWFTHEATHQLNHEVAHLPLAKWLEEGIADYIGTSQIRSNGLALGEIDTNTYPTWWSHIIATSGDVEADKKNGSIIPLKSIITNRGGPSLNSSVNLYYLHWWSLAHFLFNGENGRYKGNLKRLIKSGGNLKDFEKEIAPLSTIEPLWYQHVLKLKKEASSKLTPPVMF